MSFSVASFPSRSDSTSRFSDSSAYHWSILRSTSDVPCCSRNSFHLSYSVFFIAFGKSPETSRSPFDVKFVLMLCASLSEIRDFSVMISIMLSRYFTIALSFALNTLPSFATTALCGHFLSSSHSTYSSPFSLSNLWNGSLLRKSLDFIVFFVDRDSYSCPIAFFIWLILSTYFCILVSPSDKTSLWISSDVILSSSSTSTVLPFLSVVSPTNLSTILIIASVNGLLSTTSICFLVSHSLLNSSSLSALSCSLFFVSFSTFSVFGLPNLS